MAKIDVLMSVYNCERYIADTLASIQNQTIRDIRLVIIDDGSTDKTGEIIKAAQASDSRIDYHYQPNAGIVAAVQKGTALCTAPFIARHDGDDISYPDRFEKELAYLEQNPDCVAVSALARHIDENGSPTGNYVGLKDLSKADYTSIPATEPYIMQPLLFLRRDALGKAGGYRPLTVSEDTDLYWRMSEFGSLHIIPEMLGDYRIHSASISSQGIIAGRKLAIWSQLCAVSAWRRRAGEPDISFTPDLKKMIDAESSLSGLFSIVSPLLRKDEKSWLHSALAAKMVDICYLRPYEPDRSDIEFIRSVPVVDPQVSSRSLYAEYKEAVLSTAIRLVISGRIADALRLVSPKQLPKLAARVIFRVVLPPSVRNRIKSVTKTK
ncbi:glycosyltransferase [Acetobacter fallax]|uniref:glycosyltransferase n=1 Tax=Acetobacter fallax TaxID=1737473 RepID=UPI00156BBE7D